MTQYDQGPSDSIQVEQINNMSDPDKAEQISDRLAEVGQTYMEME